MKIKVCAGWESAEGITRRLLDQFRAPYIDLSNIEFVYDDSYDLIVFNNYVTEEIKKGKKAAIFFHEPSWVGSHQKEFNSYKEDIKVFGFNKDNYNANSEVIEYPALMFYGGRGPTSEGWDFWTYDSLTSTKFDKTKGISSLVTILGWNSKEDSTGCIYKERYDLVNFLTNTADYVDFFGWGDSGNKYPSLSEKKDGLMNYKFSLCIENSNEKNYISEKFYDCILTDTIPIYFGCKNVKELWPDGGYILIEDVRDHNAVLSLLSDIKKDIDRLYEEISPKTKLMKERYFRDYNLLDKIVNL